MSSAACSRFKNLNIADMSSPVPKSPTSKPRTKPKVRCKYIVKLKVTPARLEDRLQSMAKGCAAGEVLMAKQLWTCRCCGGINEFDPSKPRQKGPPKRIAEELSETQQNNKAMPAMNEVPKKRPRKKQNGEQLDPNNRPKKAPKQTSQQQQPKRITTFSEWMDKNQTENDKQQRRDIKKKRSGVLGGERKLKMFDLQPPSCLVNLLDLPEKIINQIFDYVMRQPDQPATFYTEKETHVHPELLPVLLVNHRVRVIALKSTYRVNTFILDSLSGLQTEWFTKDFIAKMKKMEFRIYYIDGKFLHEDGVMRFLDTLLENFTEKHIEIFPEKLTIVFNSAIGVAVPKSDWVVRIVKTFTLVFAKYARRPGVQFKHLVDPNYSWVYPLDGERVSMLEEYKMKGDRRSRPCKVRQVIENEDESADGDWMGDSMDLDEAEQ